MLWEAAANQSPPDHSARALQALGDHETAQAWEQDPQILRRHSRDDLLLTHQQQQAVAVEPHGTHQDEKGAAQPADQAAGEQAVQVTEGSRQGEDLGGENLRIAGWGGCCLFLHALALGFGQ